MDGREGLQMHRSGIHAESEREGRRQDESGEEEKERRKRSKKKKKKKRKRRKKGDVAKKVEKKVEKKGKGAVLFFFGNAALLPSLNTFRENKSDVDDHPSFFVIHWGRQ
jgi:hypothetical protein